MRHRKATLQQLSRPYCYNCGSGDDNVFIGIDFWSRDRGAGQDPKIMILVDTKIVCKKCSYVRAEHLRDYN